MTSPRQEKAGVVRHPDPAPMAAPVTADADTLLNNYAGTERHDPKALKQGCLLAFAIVMGLIMVIVTAVYFVFYAHR